MNFLIAFCLLSVLWILLSGKFDAFHLALGLISVYIVTKWSGALLIPSKKTKLLSIVSNFLRFIPYSFWLTIEIIKANFQVIKVSLQPNIHSAINPQLIELETNLKSDMSQFLYANSITLTPGTITVKLNDNKLLVHALTDETAKGLDGSMEKKVAKVFGEIK